MRATILPYAIMLTKAHRAAVSKLFFQGFFLQMSVYALSSVPQRDELRQVLP